MNDWIWKLNFKAFVNDIVQMDCKRPVIGTLYKGEADKEKWNMIEKLGYLRRYTLVFWLKGSKW